MRCFLSIFVLVIFVASMSCSDPELTNAGTPDVDVGTPDPDVEMTDAEAPAPDVDAGDVGEDTDSPDALGVVFVEITDGPEELTAQSEATFEFGCDQAAGCEYQCRIGEEEFQECESPATFEELEDGAHQFEVVATNDEGIESGPESWEWTIDTTAPEIDILAAPPQETEQGSAYFEFECSNKPECTFECALEAGGDTGDWESCSSGHSVEGLVNGEYTLYIRATDSLGNEGESSVSWTVDILGWAGVTVGFAHSCARGEDSTIWCWGSGSRGRTGHGDTEMRTEPEKVGSDSDWSMISAGRTHTCALRHDGTLWCWGEGDQGRLGTGNESNQTSPKQVQSNSDWSYISSGSYHSCGLREDGTLWCWGGNEYEQRGYGGADGVMLPQQVGSDSDWDAVSASFAHTCAIRQNNTLWCWGGGNEYGQLGMGDHATRSTPSQVGSDSDWAYISSGRRHTCATRTDGTLWCWGSNGNGQLGQGSSSSSEYLTPTQVESHSDWESVVAFNYHTCGIRQGGTLWCWGWNDFGQTGQGNTEDWYSPQQVDESYPWKSTATGSTSHSCAIQQTGTLWCWGRGDQGRLGLGDEEDKHMPHLVESQLL